MSFKTVRKIVRGQRGDPRHVYYPSKSVATAAGKGKPFKDWSFPGYFAFVLFGPFATSPDKQLGVFTTGDMTGKENGRKAARVKEKTRERQRGVLELPLGLHFHLTCQRK